MDKNRVKKEIIGLGVLVEVILGIMILGEKQTDVGIVAMVGITITIAMLVTALLCIVDNAK